MLPRCQKCWHNFNFTFQVNEYVANFLKKYNFEEVKKYSLRYACGAVCQTFRHAIVIKGLKKFCAIL